MSTTVTYKGATLTTATNQTRTLETAGKYMEDDVTIIDVTASATLQAKTNISPTTSSQTITADSGYDGLSSVQINAMPSGNAGTPTATKSAVSNHSVFLTPRVTNTTGYITGGTIAGTLVTVSASELVSGSQTITTNGTYSVTNLASVTVNVSGGGGLTDITNQFDVSGTYDTFHALYDSNSPTKDVCFFGTCGGENGIASAGEIYLPLDYQPYNDGSMGDYIQCGLTIFTFESGEYVSDFVYYDGNGCFVLAPATPIEDDDKVFFYCEYPTEHPLS